MTIALPGGVLDPAPERGEIGRVELTFGHQVRDERRRVTFEEAMKGTEKKLIIGGGYL